MPKFNRDYIDVKINFNRSDKQQIWGKYGRMWATAWAASRSSAMAGGPDSGCRPGTGRHQDPVGTIGHTHDLLPTLLLDGIVGYQRQDQTVSRTITAPTSASSSAFPNRTVLTRAERIPQHRVSGYTGFGVPGWMPLTRVEENYTHSHNLTWTKGAHELRFGFDWCGTT